MKKKSIAQLFGMISGGEEPRGESGPNGVSPAERLGRALLDTLGAADDGVTEDELVEAILGEWSAADREELYDGTDDEPEDDEQEDAPAGASAAEAGDEGDSPFAPRAKRPAPMRTGSAASDPVDYADMSSAQFRELRKLLKKAASEGKRIRL